MKVRLLVGVTPLLLLVSTLSSAETVPYHGLQSIGESLNSWTDRLLDEVSEVTEPEGVQEIYHLYLENKDSGAIDRFYEAILENHARNYGTKWKNYDELAKQIMSARKRIQTLHCSLTAEHAKKFCNPDYQRRALVLLQHLAEEVLYVGWLRAEKSPIEFRQQYLPPPTYTERVALFYPREDGRGSRGFPLVNGDIVLSKGGSGSSSFLARITDIPGSYSHATFAYVEPRTNRLWFPEAYIEDDVKIRIPSVHYEAENKRRVKIFIYRHERRSGLDVYFDKGVDAYIKEMVSRVEKPFSPFENPTHPELEKPSHYYDGTINPWNDDLSCVEMPWKLGHKMKEETGLDEEENPYRENIWSTVSGLSEEFFKKFLGIEVSRFPAPSDIEVHPNYKVVGFAYKLSKLENERIYTALVDAAIHYMSSNPGKVREFLASSEMIPNEEIVVRDLDVAKLEAVFKAHGVPWSPKIEAAIVNAPRSFKLKALLFFAYYNEVLSPTIRDQILAREEVYPPVQMRNEIYALLSEELKKLKPYFDEAFGLLKQYVDVAKKEPSEDPETKSLADKK